MNLAKISKKFGINLEYFLPRGAWITARYIVTTVILLLISVVFARLAQKETYGQYQYVLSLVSLVSIFSLPGLNTAALRAFIEGDQKSVEHSVRYSFIYSLIATAILLVIAGYYYFSSQELLGLAIALAALFLPFFYAPNNWYIYYEGKLNFRSSTLRIMVTHIILFFGLIAGLKHGLNLLGLVLIYFIVNSLLNSLFFLEGKRKTKIDSDINKLSLGYGLLCTIQRFTVSMGENLQALAVSAIFGFASLAIYQIAQSFVNAFNGLLGAMSSTYFPLLLKYHKLNHFIILLQHVGLGLGCWLVYLIMLKFVFLRLYGVSYQDSALLAQNLAYIIIILPLKTYLSNFFTANDRNQMIIAVNFVASVLALGLFFAVSGKGFIQAATIYLYVLNILILIPLLLVYLRYAITPQDVGGIINQRN